MAMDASARKGSPSSFRVAACIVANRAACTSVAMSASMNWIAWCWAMGLPKVSLCWAYRIAASRADWPMPRHWAAMIIRLESKISIA